VRPLLFGYAADKKPITLNADERKTHMHVIGSSGTGKSKFLESLIRQDLRNRQGFCLIDPHGSLYHDVLNYCAFKVLKRDIILLDLSSPESVIGFNPFKQEHGGDVSVQVDRRIAATVHAWGVSGTDETPTLERTLRLIYTTLIENQLSFHHAQYLIDFNSKQIRSEFIKSVASPLIRREWEELEQLKAKDFRAEVLSAKNRLFRLLTSKALTRFLNASQTILDIADIIENGKVLLVNLAPSDQLSAENAKVFGALLVNEFFEVAQRRNTAPGGKPRPYFLYLDEFQTFVSIDIARMLDQVRKFGLFTVLAHQRFGQLDQDITDAVLTNCRVKAVFGGLPVPSARLMAEEMFIGELDPMKIKVSIYQTKFWPKYSRDSVYTRSTSSGHSLGKGGNRALSGGSGEIQGQFFGPGDWFTYGDIVGNSLSVTQSSSFVIGEHSSETDFTGEATAEADVPIILPVPFTELSSVQFFTPEEQLLQLTAALKEQFGRHCFIKILDQKTQPMAVPFVDTFLPRSENIEWYQDFLHKKAQATPADSVDQEIAAEHESLTKSATTSNNSQAKAETAWADFFGKE